MIDSAATHQMAIIPNEWGLIHDSDQAAGRGRNEKARKSGARENWHGLCDAFGIGTGQYPPPKGKTKKMENETTNLFRRRDTFFGICEAVGQDFGFNPLWLRLAFVAPLFFFPAQTFIGYFALGIVVLASRLIFPVKTAATAQPALSAVEPAGPKTEKAEELALAA